MRNGTDDVENSMVVPQKVKDKITIWFNNSTPGYTHKSIESRITKRNLYTHVNSSIIQNSQKVQATQISIDG